MLDYHPAFQSVKYYGGNLRVMEYIRAKISNLDRSKTKEIELIADTGAIYTAIPSDILEELRIKPKGKRKFKTASGEIEELPVGEAYVEIEGEGVTTIVAFLPKGSVPLLGVTTLELLELSGRSSYE